MTTTRCIYPGERCLLSEDLHNKFTMHYKHSALEVPSEPPEESTEDCFRPLEPMSRTIAAFLNTEGGNIYVGIDENAKIRGIRLSSCMKVHFILSLNYCISMFNPPVPPNLVKVHYVELMECPSENSTVPLTPYTATQFCNPTDDNSENMDESDSMSINNDTLNHLIGKEICPCENTETAEDSKLYLIVIEVLKSCDGTIYHNDEGLLFYRGHGWNNMVTFNDIAMQMVNKNKTN